MAKHGTEELYVTSFNGRTEFLKLAYWDHRITPTIGQSHVLLFGLVKDFLGKVTCDNIQRRKCTPCFTSVSDILAHNSY